MDGRSLAKQRKAGKQKKQVSIDSDSANSPIINQACNMASGSSEIDVDSYRPENIPGNDNVGDKLDFLTKVMLQVASDVADLKKSTTYNDKQISDVKSDLKDTKSQLSDVATDLQKAHHEIATVKKENNDLKEQLIRLESQSRRDNLLIDGIFESQGENCQQKVQKFFSEVLGITDSSNIKIVRCHRVPSGPFRANRRKPRTMIVKFFWYGDRESVWEKRNVAKDKGYWISQDFPEPINERRKILLPIAAAARRQGSEATVNVDKLIIDSRSFTVKTLNQLPTQLQPRNVATRSNGSITVFFTEQSPLSNFYRAPHKDGDDNEMHSSEQAFQLAKAKHFNDLESVERIKKASSPVECYKLGQNVKGYNERAWMEVADDIMFNCVEMKFEQNPDLLEFLIGTGTTELAEACKNKVWGTGIPMNSSDVFNKVKWDGENRLGKILQRLRASLA